jgi:hypothetical protein
VGHGLEDLGDLGAPTFGGLALYPLTGRLHVLASFTGAIDADGDGDTDLDSGDATADLLWLIYDPA